MVPKWVIAILGERGLKPNSIHVSYHVGHVVSQHVAPVQVNPYPKWTQPHTPMHTYASHVYAYPSYVCMSTSLFISPNELSPGSHGILMKLSNVVLLLCHVIAVAPCLPPPGVSPTLLAFCICSPSTDPPLHIFFIIFYGHMLVSWRNLRTRPFVFVFIFLFYKVITLGNNRVMA